MIIGFIDVVYHIQIAKDGDTVFVVGKEFFLLCFCIEKIDDVHYSNFLFSFIHFDFLYL